MNSKEFVLWLKGFTEGVHEFNITPKQWDTLKEQLAHVDDNTIPMGGVIVDHNRFGTITTTPGTTGFLTYNPSTATQWNASGSAWSYTSTLTNQPTTGSNQLELEFESK